MWVMPEPGAVDRHEAIDAALQSLVEQVLHAAQVAQALFADVADEGDRARRLHVARLERADDGEDHGQAAAVVADARPANHGALLRGLDVGALGEHGVEVRGEHEVRARGRARPLAEDVAHLVDAHVLQTQLAELRARRARPRFVSLNGGASTSQISTCSSRVRASSARAAARAALIERVLHQPGAEVGGRLLRRRARGARQNGGNHGGEDAHGA